MATTTPTTFKTSTALIMTSLIKGVVQMSADKLTSKQATVTATITHLSLAAQTPTALDATRTTIQKNIETLVKRSNAYAPIAHAKLQEIVPQIEERKATRIQLTKEIQKLETTKISCFKEMENETDPNKIKKLFAELSTQVGLLINKLDELKKLENATQLSLNEINRATLGSGSEQNIPTHRLGM